MKVLSSIAIVLVFLIVSSVQAQNGWMPQTSGTAENLNSISAPSTSSITTVGDFGVVLHSIDGGLTWNTQTAPTAFYEAVSFYDDNIGVMTGSGGAIIHTTDGGSTWQEQQNGWMITYYGAHQVNEQAAFVAGVNTIFQPLMSFTTDGWQTQQDVAFYVYYQGSYNEGTVNDIHFFNETTGVAAVSIWNGNGAIVRTENQGQGWTTVAWVDQSINAIDFYTGSTGFAVGNNGIGLLTYNNGNDWEIRDTGVSVDLNDISFATYSYGWAVGDGGTIIYTDWSGNTWEPQSSGTTENLTGVSFVNTDNGWVVGDNGTILNYGEIVPWDVTVSLTHTSPPIVIPATGGSFDFNIAVTNNETSPVSFNVWTMVTLPNTVEFGPLIGPIDLNFDPGFSANRDRTQVVPANAPAGMYTYDAYVGIYPDIIWNEDHFDFEKLATGDGIAITGWECWGESFVDAVEETANLPAEIALGSAYPNPFNPKTVLSYKLQAASLVNLSVYDISGRLVTELVNAWRDAGVHEVMFDGSDLSSGVYLYRLTAGEFTNTGKMVLLK
ncbi:hypothetical protein CEE37_14090 [candidate division LCP-89 bacterium B3_LCP]|uniref:Secretion system C-terminal sorting domain-containing protein n=1 Tax=candidate division LCP-89 bacterium B3_LCP TaxID=2012998 RepID=A0A532UQN3_UNCL8|nr:MAG: hypothetical protein CEE37_14090 [candidate division LCP-89 bacterium B3_LCP]